MECHATPRRLWRERRNLEFFIEPSFALGAPLSLFLLQLVLFFFTSTQVMHSCRHEAKPRACNKCMAFGEVKKREKMLTYVDPVLCKIPFPCLSSMLGGKTGILCNKGATCQ